MSEINDHAIQNRVRAILFRRWIDIREVTFGSVNGVVTVRGSLTRNPLFPVPPERNGERESGLLQRGLERDLLAIDGVKDLVLDLKTRGGCQSCSAGEEGS